MQKSLLRGGAINLWLAAVFFGALGLAWAAPLTLTQQDSGRTLTLPVGQRLVVDLQLGPDHAVVAPEFDPWILILEGQQLQSTFGAQGSSSRVVYTFVVRQAGRTDLVIAARDSKNKTGKPEPILKVKIVATGGGQGV
jgi:hypothetical protein